MTPPSRVRVCNVAHHHQQVAAAASTARASVAAPPEGVRRPVSADLLRLSPRRRALTPPSALLPSAGQPSTDGVKGAPAASASGGGGSSIFADHGALKARAGSSVSADQDALKARADEWVQAAAGTLSSVVLGTALPLRWGPPRPDGRCGAVVSINTQALGDEYFQDLNAGAGGITVVDLFGGLGAGLEAQLRNGTVVKRYLYADSDDVTRRIMQHRLEELHGRYPLQFPRSASAQAFTALPQNVTLIGREQLLKAGAGSGDSRWFVMAGWPCQDFSPAGRRMGLGGPRAGTYYALLRILATLQELQPGRPPAYLIENGPMQMSFAADNNVERDFNIIVSQLGRPVLVDAARFDSFAYRLRNWWTNTVSPFLETLV